MTVETIPVTPAELLAAAEARGAAAERAVCAALVCELCRKGDRPIYDPRRWRGDAVEAARTALNAEEIRADPELRADARKTAHRRFCFICREGSDELCANLDAAGVADLFFDHRRTCGHGCRSKKGQRPTVCRVGRDLRQDMREAACRASRRRPFQERRENIEQDLAYPDEFFHVDPSGKTWRCAATAILLRDPTLPQGTFEETFRAR